jgi:hypothetical protein
MKHLWNGAVWKGAAIRPDIQDDPENCLFNRMPLSSKWRLESYRHSTSGNKQDDEIASRTPGLLYDRLNGSASPSQTRRIVTL